MFCEDPLTHPTRRRAAGASGLHACQHPLQPRRRAVPGFSFMRLCHHGIKMTVKAQWESQLRTWTIGPMDYNYGRLQSLLWGESSTSVHLCIDVARSSRKMLIYFLFQLFHLGSIIVPPSAQPSVAICEHWCDGFARFMFSGAMVGCQIAARSPRAAAPITS